ncbi:MAG: hypothetical protein EOO36_08610 [Cytophagaceae bacterium]|nr:MAG: hypothetical protein EOO36_08610 [Cytophagaceae bacterium]
MSLLRPLQVAGVLSLGAVSLSGCLSEPSYPTTPSISFNSIERKRFTIGNAVIDSVFLTIDFQDGDGDLGVTDAEEKAAANTKFKGRNFIMTPFIKNASTGGRFDSLSRVRPFYATRTAFYDRFGHLSTTTDNRVSPLRGTLTRAYRFALTEEYEATNEAKFTVSILDRALHQSNEIETTSIVIPAP